MMTGATRVAPELTNMATSATIIRPRSSAIRGTKRLIAVRSEVLLPNALVFSSLYFIVTGAPLRIVDLHVFRGSFHQFAMGSRSQNLSFHQENDPIVVLDRRDLLRHRDQSDAGVFLLNV